MPQDPQVIFRGTGLISGSSCEPIVLMASEEELSLSLGFGLRFKLAPRDVIKIEPVQEKQLSILHCQPIALEASFVVQKSRLLR